MQRRLEQFTQLWKSPGSNHLTSIQVLEKFLDRKFSMGFKAKGWLTTEKLAYFLEQKEYYKIHTIYFRS